MATSSWLRIAVVQFAPKLGEVHANIAKARELCRGLTPRSVDLVCFPEMIFTGYMFPSASSIAPYLEHPKTGPTSMFCATLAKHLQCYVTAGFPQRLDLEPFATAAELPMPMPDSDPPPPPSFVGANAALLYDATGDLLHTYHKSNLFQTDLTWARPGPGFSMLDLPIPFGRMAVAICNDMNVCVRGPNGGVWGSIEGGPYELAEYCRREGVRMLVLLNAWLMPEEEEREGGAVGSDAGGRGGAHDHIASTGTDGNGQLAEDDDDPDGDDEGLEPNWRVLNYWAMRLRPLWDAGAGMNTDTGEGPRRPRTEMSYTDDERDCLVIICNRFGHERGKTFAGSSAMFSMCPGSGKPRLLHVMGEREEGISVWTVRIGSHTLA